MEAERRLEEEEEAKPKKRVWKSRTQAREELRQKEEEDKRKQKEEEEAERHQKRQKEEEEEQEKKKRREEGQAAEAAPAASSGQAASGTPPRHAPDWQTKAEELAAERLGRPAPRRAPPRPVMQRREAVVPPPGFQPVTTEDYLRQKNFAIGRWMVPRPQDPDEDGWFPLHHAIQDTLLDAGLLDVVLELARGMPVEAFDRLANNPRASG